MGAEQDDLALFMALTHAQQIQIIKQLITEQIMTADCWDRCDYRAIRRITSLLLKSPK